MRRLRAVPGSLSYRNHYHPAEHQPGMERSGGPGEKSGGADCTGRPGGCGRQVRYSQGENSIGKLAAALRRMGFDEIYDTNFGADLTVMEETKEFQERLRFGENLPLYLLLPGLGKIL